MGEGVALTSSKSGLKTKSARVWRAVALPALRTLMRCVKVSPGWTLSCKAFDAAASAAATTVREASVTFVTVASACDAARTRKRCCWLSGAFSGTRALSVISSVAPRCICGVTKTGMDVSLPLWLKDGWYSAGRSVSRRNWSSLLPALVMTSGS
jgi:hypothetical protein